MSTQDIPDTETGVEPPTDGIEDTQGPGEEEEAGGEGEETYSLTVTLALGETEVASDAWEINATSEDEAITLAAEALAAEYSGEGVGEEEGFGAGAGMDMEGLPPEMLAELEGGGGRGAGPPTEGGPL